MSVDIVIVNWNGGPELLEAISSAQRFGGNAIVVDNYAAKHLGRGAAAFTVLAAPVALAIGVALDVGHSVTRRP